MILPFLHDKRIFEGEVSLENTGALFHGTKQGASESVPLQIISKQVSLNNLSQSKTTGLGSTPHANKINRMQGQKMTEAVSGQHNPAHSDFIYSSAVNLPAGITDSTTADRGDVVKMQAY